ncbi:hypothetical protein [Caproiciproducens sp. LBM24188]|nr:hypothetical protein [Clostridiales bacterium]
MDYTGYYEFPFPSSEDNVEMKKFFYSLPDEEQLRLLNGSPSYQSFRERLLCCMKDK